MLASLNKILHIFYFFLGIGKVFFISVLISSWPIWPITTSVACGWECLKGYIWAQLILVSDLMSTYSNQHMSCLLPFFTSFRFCFREQKYGPLFLCRDNPSAITECSISWANGAAPPVKQREQFWSLHTSCSISVSPVTFLTAWWVLLIHRHSSATLLVGCHSD